MITLTTVTDALKNLYLNPMREDINLKADPFAARILQTSDNIVGKKIIRAAQIGANGGVGAGTETGALPASAENMYKQLESDTKNLYGSLTISDKVMKSATGQNAGSFVNVLQQDIDTLLKTARWNLARQIYGDGSSNLMTLKANATSSKVIEAATGDNTKFLVPGLCVDVHATAGTVADADKGVRIEDVDHKNKKIILSKSRAVTAGDYITIQGSAGNELTGLGKIFETVGDTSALYGLIRKDYSWMKPYLDSSFGAISEVGLQKVINILEDTYNIKINHINCGNDAYGYYMNLLNARRSINDKMTLVGGHEALVFNSIPVTRNKFMPDAGIDMYDTSLFTMDQISDWEWIEGETRQILHQKSGYPTYEATLAKYCDMMCVLPGGLARLTGVSAAS